MSIFNRYNNSTIIRTFSVLSNFNLVLESGYFVAETARQSSAQAHILPAGRRIHAKAQMLDRGEYDLYLNAADLDAVRFSVQANFTPI